MDFMFDWEGENDRFSFEDSDRFEEDSLCSWISEPESLCNNWRGWRKQNGGQPTSHQYLRREDVPPGVVTSLTELASQAVACQLPFEVVEHFYPPIPEQLQLRIAFWSFPENEEDIRLYSCLANGSADEFQKGDHLYKARAVKDALQIGFHLSATVVPPQTLVQAKGSFNVAVVFDRRRITSCNCTCSSSASWCAHVVALCLYRIHQATLVCLRAPVSESLSRLHRDQLQKFAQYLISELPQQILPTAQRLLDELLSSQQTAMNTVCGAPDPTAGPSASEQTSWCLDESTLHENIKKTLIKFCVPSPIVFSDVNYLSSTAPPAAAEWQSLLRPLRGREPEGMWNLLSIVREMYKRHDSNAIPLLEILTDEVLACEQILVWWFNTKISASHNSTNCHSTRNNQNCNSSSQHAASSLCDEIVLLWRLAALNPALSPIQRDDLSQQVKDWHMLCIDKVRKARGNSNMTANGTTNAVKKSDIEIFPGFKSSLEACQLDWCDYTIVGVTYVEKHPTPWRFSFGKAQETECGGARGRGGRTGKHHTSQVSGVAMKAPDMHGHLAAYIKSQEFRYSAVSAAGGSGHAEHNQVDRAYSSSSEGFCDSERRESGTAAIIHDSDSDLGAELEATARPKAGKEPHLVDDVFSAASNLAAAQQEIPAAKISKAMDGDGLPGPIQALAVQAVPLPVIVAPRQPGDVSESDEYQMYFYDTRAAKAAEPGADKKKKDEPNYFAGIRKMDNQTNMLFSRAEALHAHGHTHEACLLAKKLSEEMLANPPDLTAEQPQPTGKGKKKKTQNNTSSFASTTLAKAAFLCNVLLEEQDCHHLAFRVGLFGLEMPRAPAASKALDVKLAYQESELVTLLKRIPLGVAELAVIKDRAEKLRDGKLKMRGEALLPLTLASFIFDSLCLPVIPPNVTLPIKPGTIKPGTIKPPPDEKLGFDACVEALGLKANVSEAEHPLLCEGTRRQRGELAVAMLVHYKDDQVKLSKIMEKLLDKEVHQLYKAPSISNYLTKGSATNSVAPPNQAVTSSTPGTAAVATGTMPNMVVPATQAGPMATVGMAFDLALNGGMMPMGQKGGLVPDCESDDSMREDNGTPRSSSSTLVSLNNNEIQAIPASGVQNMSWQGGPEHEVVASREGDQAERLEYLNLEQKFSSLHMEPGAVGARPKTSFLSRYNSKDTDSSAVEEDCESADYKAWEAKFRCLNLKKVQKHSTGMGSIDSSAPETTSSDNSPTLVRRNWGKHPQGPGSDSGSSGKSSDSIGSSNSGDKAAAAAKLREEQERCESPPTRFAPHLALYSRSSTPSMKGVRYKGKNRCMPTVPNQPSEASAHFMFELAKNVLTKAGGNSSTSLFTQPNSNNNPTGPQRNLHLCAFQVGLYALGLHNCVSPNWLSRTYSSHVSWITGQAMEIGSAAINILIDTWEGHLTPQEVASLADRASRGRDPNMVKAAAELALSCLPQAQALNPNEIQRALIQCKEQSQEMLERACLAVESAAKGGGVNPEVLFDMAKRWYELYEEAMAGPSGPVSNAGHTRRLQQQVSGRQSAANDQVAAVQATQALVPVPVTAAIQVLAQENSNNSPPVLQLVPAQSLQGTVAGAQATISVQTAQQGQLPPGAVAVQPIPYSIPHPGPNHGQVQPHHPYIAPYSYVQQIPPNLAHHYSAPPIALHTHNIHPSYMASYPYQSQQQNYGQVPHLNNNTATLYHANIGHLRPPPPQAVQVYAAANAAMVQNKFGQLQAVELQNINGQQQPAAIVVQQVPIQAQQQAVPQGQQAGHQGSAPGNQPAEVYPTQNSPAMNYLLATYRVGMLAMETLARRVHDDRPQQKYARNPPYGEEVKWLLAIAMKLMSYTGTNYLQQFCASAVNAVVSPFVLQEIAVESAHFLARGNPNPAQVSQQLRSPTLNSLVQKCLQMYIQCTHQRMHHINVGDYEEFVSVVCSARNAFCMTPGGMVQFNELLQSLRRSKSCKKDLWQRIMSGLAAGPI